MNIFSTKHLKKITKASLALVLAGSFTVSTVAFADETTTETTNNYETVDLQELQSELENSQAETPSVVPGDFFYFAKIALEKITLAFTFDDAKEAELMATYASERLAEAAALFGEGKETEALEVIQTAIEYMENSQAIIDDVSGSDEAVADDADSTTDVTDEAVTDETKTDEAVSEDAVVDEENGGEQGDLDEVEGTLRHNIIALTKAMEHVGNDQARASLQKNIDKTYAKIAKKLAKLEKKYGTTETEDENNAVTEETTNTEEVVTPAPDADATPETSESVPATTAEETTNTTVTAPQTTESVQSSNSKAPQTKGFEKKQEKQAGKAQPEKGNSAQAQQNKPEQKGNNK